MIVISFANTIGSAMRGARAASAARLPRSSASRATTSCGPGSGPSRNASRIAGSSDAAATIAVVVRSSRCANASPISASPPRRTWRAAHSASSGGGLLSCARWRTRYANGWRSGIASEFVICSHAAGLSTSRANAGEIASEIARSRSISSTDWPAIAAARIAICSARR
jgi:hypothetical protein